ncbi:hypothetical protein PENSUB_10096 [Penicillium subrubescens]|uniref:Uncharacterized protein n=1 Tax=Penicillium subrubescens TaxID=1316194 RepID=A0A1Q5TAP4_9EURO|nr:hypothetical protein PENSUB_10096 [Penicillium subrubescens]
MNIFHIAIIRGQQLKKCPINDHAKDNASHKGDWQTRKNSQSTVQSAVQLSSGPKVLSNSRPNEASTSRPNTQPSAGSDEESSSDSDDESSPKPTGQTKSSSNAPSSARPDIEYIWITERPYAEVDSCPCQIL